MNVGPLRRGVKYGLIPFLFLLACGSGGVLFGTCVVHHCAAGSR